MKIFSKDSIDIIKFFLVKVIIGFIGIFAVSIYSYWLSPDSYGEYSLILGIVKVLIAIFIGWIGSAALRYYDQYKNENKKIFTNVIIQWIVMTAVMSLIALVLGFFIKDVLIIKYYWCVVLLLVFMGFVEIFEKILRASKNTNTYLISIVLQSLMNVLIFYILAKKFNLSIYAIFIANIVSNAIFTIIVFITFKLPKKISIKELSKDINVKFFKYGLPMVGIWGISWFLNAADRYIIRLYQSSYEVGIYDIAYHITESSVNMVISAFTLAIFPILISKWNQKGKKEVEQYITKILNYFFMLIIPAVLGLIAIRKNLYGTVVSNEYLEGNAVIIYVGIGLLFNGYNQIIYKLWQLKEKPNKILMFMIISVILNIILNIILIPIIGFVAAAITTLISYIVSTILATISLRKDFKIKIEWKRLIKTIICSMIMFIIIKLIVEKVKSLWRTYWSDYIRNTNLPDFINFIR